MGFSLYFLINANLCNSFNWNTCNSYYGMEHFLNAYTCVLFVLYI